MNEQKRLATLDARTTTPLGFNPITTCRSLRGIPLDGKAESRGGLGAHHNFLPFSSLLPSISPVPVLFLFRPLLPGAPYAHPLLAERPENAFAVDDGRVQQALIQESDPEEESDRFGSLEF